MKIIAVDRDKFGIALSDKNVSHAIKYYDRTNKTVSIMMGSMAVVMTTKEVKDLLSYLNNIES